MKRPRSPPPVATGDPAPLGATPRRGGTNFSVYSRSATAIDLEFFEHAGAGRPSRVVKLDRARHRTDHYWHAFVPGIRAGQLYGYRGHGPFAPERGHRFDATKLLLDPYGRAVATPEAYSRRAAHDPGDNAATAMKSVVADPAAYDWEGDRPLRRPCCETVIYELHVRGFTRHPSSGVARGKAGTYAGLIEKIPYLRDLGVTAVELLPIFQFDPQDAPAGRTNYWGYAPVALFAPHSSYSSLASRRGSGRELAALDEFRDLVKAMHRAGIEVILDVVFNHTAEGNEHGPTFGFRGLENETYYALQNDRSRYADHTGTGNTLNASHAVVRRLILDSLRYWVEHMHVDGFRFDLASVLARDESGRPMPNPPVLWDIESDPALAGTKLIAEAWDAAGLYQVGSFVGDAWREWNGKFRDDVRRFLKGDDGTVKRVAARMLGSPDLYGHEQREPEQSVNFVTCHDGFTLRDLVSYDRKHNDANGESGRDGADDNASWNCGAEGPSGDPAVEELRDRQTRNFLTVLMLSVGTPMLTMGDEVGRTQGGNNNAYAQDNEVSWFDWSLVEKHRALHRFVRELIAFRMRRDVVIDRAMLTLNELLQRARIDWHGIALRQPDWSDSSHSLACTVASLGDRFRLHAMLNAYWEPLRFELPEGAWLRWIDTSRRSPHDAVDWNRAPRVIGERCEVAPRSIVVLVSRPAGVRARKSSK